MPTPVEIGLTYLPKTTVPPSPLAPTALREYITVYCYNFIIQQKLKKGMIDIADINNCF